MSLDSTPANKNTGSTKRWRAICFIERDVVLDHRDELIRYKPRRKIQAHDMTKIIISFVAAALFLAWESSVVGECYGSL